MDNKILKVKKALILGSGGIKISQAGEFDYSHVLKALDLSFDDLKSSVRVSFEKDTKTEDLQRLIEALIDLH